MKPLELAMTRLGHSRLLVYGDLMLDRYIWGSAERVSPEAPVIVLKATDRDACPGGAANAAHAARAIGADVCLAGVVGDDVDGHCLCRILTDAGIRTDSILVDEHRETTVKERLMGQSPSRNPVLLLRVDHESTKTLDVAKEERLMESLRPEVAKSDAVLISDYAKGACTPKIVRFLIQTAREHEVPLLIDPSSRQDFNLYRGATILKPNRHEAAQATGHPVSSVTDAVHVANRLRTRYDFASVVVTLDREGVVYSDSQGATKHLVTRTREICDITGAGDLVLAVLGMCCAAGMELGTACELANTAAGVKVTRLGSCPVSRLDLERAIVQRRGRINKCISLEHMTRLAEQYRRRRDKVVFTNGCFDLVHVGHTRYLQEAAQFGDVLVVAINSDESVARLKGDSRPILPVEQRAALLSALECVDHVLVYEGQTPHQLLGALRPDVLVKGGTYRPEEVVGGEVVTAYGGQVLVMGMTPGVSTTSLIERLQSLVSESPGQCTLEAAARMAPTAIMNDG